MMKFKDVAKILLGSTVKAIDTTKIFYHESEKIKANCPRCIKSTEVIVINAFPYMNLELIKNYKKYCRKCNLENCLVDSLKKNGWLIDDAKRREILGVK